MKKQIYFRNMFPDYEPPEEVEALFSQAVIEAADLDPLMGWVIVAIHSPRYIPTRFLDQAAHQIGKIYGLKHMELTATFPETELQKMETGDLMRLFVAENSMLRATLAGARWEWYGTDLTIYLRANGKKAVEEAIPKVEHTLREWFAAPVNILVQAGENLEGAALFEAV